MSLYLPCDQNYNLIFDCSYIIYAHTHSGCWTEGTFLVDEGIWRNLGIVLFDFRANGYSSGKYVTLGWYEALDLNSVCTFLIKDARAKHLIIWGRSMGASATVFFMS